ncbi:MAG: endonuclease III [Spirochaetales bacterium]|nr:endonuclease III [Spirochaetales bacterium]
MDSIYDYDEILNVLKASYESGPSPSVTLIANTLKTPYNVLVSTIISLRTKDQVTLAASQRLFERADDVYALQMLTEEEIGGLIYPAGFYKTKAKNLKKIADIVINQYGGNIPDEMDDLLKLPGVGRKTANLVLILGCNKLGLCVDTHVHTVSNRLGWVNTKTPDETEFALRELLPVEHWRLINDYLVSFGQKVCVPVSPFCSRCGLNEVCHRNGVTKNR